LAARAVRDERGDAAPSRIAIVSGGVITACLLLVFLVM